jgi:GNAT superfamily N-acetyltransferase
MTDPTAKPTGDPLSEAGRQAEADYLGWVDRFADTSDVSVVRAADVRYRTASVPLEYLNGVFGTWFGGDDADARIAEVIAAMSADGRPFTWTIWPSDTPADVHDRLVGVGFEALGDEPLMAVDLPTPDLDERPPDGLVVRAASTPDDIAAAASLALGTLGDADEGLSIFARTLRRLADTSRPELRLFGGWLDDELVATSGLFTGTGVAGIYAVATSEARRGRGFGRALTLAAMRAGAEAGMARSVLLASELGEPIYRRLGFRTVAQVRFLRWPGVALEGTHEPAG